MKVKRLSGPPYAKVQCSLPKGDLAPNTLGWAGYRELRSNFNGQSPDRCMRHARWEIDGERLCTQHAGMRALEFLER